MYPRIKEVYIQNYKSIEKARVKLEPFTILVGANGTGKSNFMDAISFVRDCVIDSPDKALAYRNGMWQVSSRFQFEDPVTFGIRLEIELSASISASYAFTIGPKDDSERRYKPEVKREWCRIEEFNAPGIDSGPRSFIHGYEVRLGKFVESTHGIEPSLTSNRLALSIFSGLDEFGKLYEFLSDIRNYSIVPNALRETRLITEPNDYLRDDGRNSVSIIGKIFRDNKNYNRLLKRVNSLIASISSGTKSIAFSESASHRLNASVDDDDATQTLSFNQSFGETSGFAMPAAMMSDGTLRALGCLIAAYQPGNHSVVMIEEPEATIHPGASEVLVQAFNDASNERQIVISTHSADILDVKDIKAEQIRVFDLVDGRTVISPVDESGKGLVRDRLFMPGELMRINELTGDNERTLRNLENFDLFGMTLPEDSESL